MCWNLWSNSFVQNMHACMHGCLLSFSLSKGTPLDPSGSNAYNNVSQQASYIPDTRDHHNSVNHLLHCIITCFCPCYAIVWIVLCCCYEWPLGKWLHGSNDGMHACDIVELSVSVCQFLQSFKSKQNEPAAHVAIISIVPDYVMVRVNGYIDCIIYMYMYMCM